MKTITASLYIAAKPEPIYDALTKAPGVAALLFGSRLETTFEPGAPYAYVGPDGKGGEAVHVEGEVLACEPGKRLVGFGRESVKEVKKVVWPTRKEATQSTGLVFLFVLVMALFLWIVDKIVEWGLYDLILGWKR